MTAYSGARFPTKFNGRVVAAILACYGVLNLHLLRNLTSFYVVLPGICYLVAFFLVVQISRPATFSIIQFMFSSFLAFTGLAFVHTLFIYGWQEAAFGLGRFCITLPMCYLVSRGLPLGKPVRILLWAFVGFVIVAVASIAMQYITGPVSWFPEPGQRAGTDRFGSLLGSIPTLGSAVPIAFYCNGVLRIGPARRTLINMVLLWGLLICLSKEAIAGTVLATTLMLFTVRQGRIRRLLSICASLGLAFGALTLIDEDIGPFVRYAIAIVDPTAEGAAEARGGDTDLSSSMSDRVGSLPLQTLGYLKEQEGENGYFLGGGFGMVGAALMRPDISEYFTAHNQYVDMLVIGGIGLLMSYCALVFYTIYILNSIVRACRARGQDEDLAVTMRGIMILFAVFSLFGGGLTFQPALSAIWWMLVGIAWGWDQNVRNCRTNPGRGEIVFVTNAS